MADQLERNTRTVMILTMVSRLSGLLRVGVLSRLFGTDAMLGSFYFAFIIPNLFRRLFGEGALAASFLPEYQKHLRDDPNMASAVAGLTAGGLLAGLGAIVMIAELVLFLIVAMPGTPGPALWLTMIMLPYAPLICCVALFGAMLQVHGRFGPTAAAPIILNVCLASAAALGWWLLEPATEQERLGITAIMAGGVVLAGVLQAVWSWLALRKLTTLRLDRSGMKGVRTVLHKMAPMLVGLGVLQINALFDGLIASWPNLSSSDTIFGVTYPLDVHAMSVLTFAQRLYQFPLGVFGVAVATAIYPLLAARATDPAGFSDMTRRGLRLVLFVGLPASAGLLLVRTPLTAVLLQGGNFGTADTDRVAFVLAGYATSIWAYCIVQVLTRSFYAKGDLKTPVRLAMLMVVLNLVLNLLLIWTPLKEAGLAWSTAFCGALQALALWAVLHRSSGGLMHSDLIGSALRSLLATGVMAGAVAGLMYLLGAATTWTASLIHLLCALGLGLAIYAACAAWARMPELQWAMGRSIDPNRPKA